MPATKRSKPLYERGGFQLVRRPDRKYLEIVWYDQALGRERSVSAGTSDPVAGRAALDRVYLERVGGEHICPTCGQRRQAEEKHVTSAIADYLTLSADKSSINAIRARLAHVLRQRMRQTDWGEIEIFLGHDRFDDVSDLYAPLRLDYLAHALSEIERLTAEIEAQVPGAFPVASRP